MITTNKKAYKALKTRIAPLLAIAIRNKRDKLKEVGKVLRFSNRVK